VTGGGRFATKVTTQEAQGHKLWGGQRREGPSKEESSRKRRNKTKMERERLEQRLK